MARLILSILGGLLAGGVADGAFAAQVTLTPSKTAAILDRQGSPADLVLLEFSLPASVDSSATITRAMLSFPVDCGEGGEVVLAHAVPVTWEAGEVSDAWWRASQAEFDFNQARHVDVEDCTGDHVRIDIAPYVRRWVADPGGNYGLLLRRPRKEGGRVLDGTLEGAISLKVIYLQRRTDPGDALAP
jgi:hypothetical protein